MSIIRETKQYRHFWSRIGQIFASRIKTPLRVLPGTCKALFSTQKFSNCKTMYYNVIFTGNVIDEGLLNSDSCSGEWIGLR